MKDTAEHNIHVEDTADNSKNRGYSTEDTAEIIKVETQQGVIHIDNTAERYTREDTAENLKVEDTAESYTHR
jgi:hypothetical protein